MAAQGAWTRPQIAVRREIVPRTGDLRRAHRRQLVVYYAFGIRRFRPPIMRPILAWLWLAAAGGCFAAPTTIKVPDQNWSVNFDSPAPLQAVAGYALPGSYFSGTDGRFNVSLFIAAPWCTGGTSAYDNYKCLRPRLYATPGIVEPSISLENRTGTVQVSYVVYVAMGDKAVKMMHTHVLFEHDGKWGDLHMSIMKPTVDEIATVIGLGDRFSIGVSVP